MVAISYIQLLLDVALVLGALLGISAALVGLAKSPVVGKPLTWVWQRLVLWPVGGWFRHIVADAVDERITHRLNRPNGGNSLHDIASALDRIQDHLGLDPRPTRPSDERCPQAPYCNNPQHNHHYTGPERRNPRRAVDPQPPTGGTP